MTPSPKSRSTSSDLLRRVKQVISRVRHTHFLPNLRSTASSRRRFSTSGVHPLNTRRARKHPAALMAHHIHKQPRNRIRIRRSHIRNRFPRNAAPVARLPRRPSKMFAEVFAIHPEKPRIRRLQRLSAPPALILAHVNLIPHRMDLKNKPLPRRRLDLLRNSLRAHTNAIPSHHGSLQSRGRIYPNSSRPINQPIKRPSIVRAAGIPNYPPPSPHVQ